MRTDANRRRVVTLDEVADWRGAPLILFMGVTTGGSNAHDAFPAWVSLLGRPWVLRGVNLPANTAPESYRHLVRAMRDNPRVHGAVITAHKLRLYRCCVDSFDRRDPLVDLTHEVNTLATRASIDAYARDALSLTFVLPRVAAVVGLRATDPLNLLCLGSGGAATALLLALQGRSTAGGYLPTSTVAGAATFVDINRAALDALHATAARIGADLARLRFVHAESADDCEALLDRMPRPGIVINATGLGKDVPGSPLTDRARFGPGLFAWDLNYRGDLRFLRQAFASGVPSVDGWDYFVAGWAGALTAIAGTELTPGLLSHFAQSAESHRGSSGLQPGVPH